MCLSTEVDCPDLTGGRVVGGGPIVGASGCSYMIVINPPCNRELLISICEELGLYVWGFANHQRGVCASIPNGNYNDVWSYSGGGTNTPQTYCTEITKRSGAVYKVCCEGGAPTQIAGAGGMNIDNMYKCNSPCTGNCVAELISE